MCARVARPRSPRWAGRQSGRPADDGETALATACTDGNVDLTRALLDAPGERKGWESSAEVVANDYCSPLWPAMEWGRIEIVRLLCSEEYRPRVMIELEFENDEDNEYGMDYLARANGYDEAADILENIEFVRRRAGEEKTTDNHAVLNADGVEPRLESIL